MKLLGVTIYPVCNAGSSRRKEMTRLIQTEGECDANENEERDEFEHALQRDSFSEIRFNSSKRLTLPGTYGHRRTKREEAFVAYGGIPEALAILVCTIGEAETENCCMAMMKL